MWALQNLADYERQLKWYGKKHPRELAATLQNLDVFFRALQSGGKVQHLTAAYRFLRPEQAGVIAVAQRGGGKNLAETRLYTYPDEPNELLYLITIGDKNTQGDDVQFSKEFVNGLRKANCESQEGEVDPPGG